jgi:citronellyl-CoA dehydrogenase
MSQIVVPTDIRGFEVRRTLRKLGNRCSDTAELSFTDLRVPVDFTIGTIGRGFQQQMWQFERERMIACYLAVGAMQAALERTVGYLRTRSVFGEPLLANQHIQYRLAELDAELEALRQLNYGCAEALIRGENIARMSSIAKLKAGRLQREVADACLQLHGGIGYMEELWTARFFRDARLLSIGGGADEVMLRTISRLSGFTP